MKFKVGQKIKYPSFLRDNYAQRYPDIKPFGVVIKASKNNWGDPKNERFIYRIYIGDGIHINVNQIDLKQYIVNEPEDV